jgi:hypothetical protein
MRRRSKNPGAIEKQTAATEDHEAMSAAEDARSAQDEDKQQQNVSEAQDVSETIINNIRPDDSKSQASNDNEAEPSETSETSPLNDSEDKEDAEFDDEPPTALDPLPTATKAALG